MENNIYYRHMDIGLDWVLKDPDYIKKLSDTVKDKFAAHWKLDASDLTDEYLTWLDKHNLLASWVELFYCSPKGNIFLHKDEIHPPHGCKMNWVYDQGETWMRWFSLKEGKQIQKHDNTIGGIYYTANEGDYEFTTQTRVGKPTLVNAYELHDVINPSNYPRWALSVVPQFKHIPESRLVWSDAMKLFAPYFI